MGGHHSWALGLLVLLWSAVASSSGDSEVALEAFFGKDTLLPCKAPFGSDLENLALEWTRPDLGQSYVFLFRDGRPFLVYQHPRFKGRVELSDPTLLSGDLSIKLKDVEQQDVGRYECHVYSRSHVTKRSAYNTKPIRTIDLTVREPLTIQAFPGEDVLLPLKTTDVSVTSLMWKREDDPEHFVFLSGMDHPHHQHPRYSGRTELTGTGDLTVRLRNVQPGDSGTYIGRIEQRRVKRELRPSEVDSVVVLQVLSNGALGLGGGATVVVAVVMAMVLQMLECFRRVYEEGGGGGVTGGGQRGQTLWRLQSDSSMTAARSFICAVVLLRSALSVSLRAEPDRCWFVTGQSVSFSCDGSADWTVLRNTSGETFSQCGLDWGRRSGSGCRVSAVLPLDSGLYWCESDDGRRSEHLNISVSEKLEPNVSTACATASTTTTATTTITTTTSAPHPPHLLWPVLGCGLGVLLGLVLVLLGLTVKRCRRRAEQDGRPEEITYSEIRVSHDRRRPVKRVQESGPSPVYSAVKTKKEEVYARVERRVPAV